MRNRCGKVAFCGLVSFLGYSISLCSSLYFLYRHLKLSFISGQELRIFVFTDGASFYFGLEGHLTGMVGTPDKGAGSNGDEAHLVGNLFQTGKFVGRDISGDPVVVG